ncbi:MAG: protein kinase, partial [Planctomycetes bacterium]|nr:protein kinase [Planctomycetota bacterium]
MSKKNIDARMSMFGRLAVESGLVTYEDIVACIEEQEKYRANGEAAPKLGELLVIRGLLTEQEVEMILKMQANPGGLIGRQLLERGLVTREQLREALDEQAEYVQNGMTPPRIGEMLVEKGMLKRDDLEKILKKKEAPAGNYLGEFLVNHRLVKAEDVSRCLAIQKHAAEQGEKAPRLGELLVSCGVLRQEQVDLYTRRHAQERRKVAPAIASTVGVATTMSTGAEKRRKLRRRVGEYELLENIGQHYDGVTYRALHTGSGAVVVLHQFNPPSETIARSITGLKGHTTQIPKPGAVPVPQAVAAPNVQAPAGSAPVVDSDRFIGEVEVEVDAVRAVDGFGEKIDKAMRLRGPSNQTVLASEQFSGRAVIADYIEGVTLERVVAEKGKMEWSWAAEILYDLSAILAQAEAMDLIHDDIRPGSIFIDAAGKARLGLWCYTRNPVDNRDWLAHKHHPIAFYFAPERVSGLPSVKADIFSLGVTMVHILTGSAPVRGNSAADAIDQTTAGQITQDMVMDMDLPMELIDLVSNMVDPNPANRPASFADIRARVGRLAEVEQLEFDIASTAVSVKEAMSLEEAKTVIGRFLSAALPSRESKRVTWRQLVRYFFGPLAAMILIMVGVTVMYKTTQSSHGLMVRARWLDQQGDKAGALELFRMIATLYPNNEVIQTRYFDLAMEVRDHGEAEIALENLLRIHPERYDEYRELQGDLQVWQRRFASAADVYRELLQARPADNALRAKLASALLWGHDYTEALREYRELTNREPNEPAHLLGMARAASGAGNREEAADLFAQLFEMRMLPENSIVEYGWILNDLGRTAELRELAGETLAQSESLEFSQKNLVTLNFWAGDYSRARSLLDSLAMQSGDDKESLLFRITLNDKLGDRASVIEGYKRLAELEPGNVDNLLTL